MKLIFRIVIVLFFLNLSASSQSCLPEGIMFTSQTEIDSFQMNYPGCSIIEGDVWIHGGDITNLDGLSVLNEIGGGLLIDSTNLSNLQGLNLLTLIGEDFQLYSNFLLDNVTGLDSLTEITGSIDFSFTGVENFLGMPQLTYLGGLETYYTGLSSFTGLEGLTSIHGDLKVMFNAELENFSGLENIQSLNGGALVIEGTNIRSLTGLENIESNSIADLWIALNDSLTECAVASICNYITDPNGVCYIHANAPGCNSLEEVSDACFTEIFSSAGQEKSITIHPIPARDILHFSSDDYEPVREIMIYNQIGQMVLHQKGMFYELDISGFQPGLYFIILHSKETAIKEKIIKI
jgi:hypothetical protein